MKTSLNICHLYYDVLNLYGDTGNITALSKRCLWRDIDVNIFNVTIGDDFIKEDYDMIFIGGGQDYEQEIVREDMLHAKGEKIKEAIEEDVVILAICGGYQLLGKSYKTADGKELEFLAALDFWTEAGNQRKIGNIVFECDFLKINGCDGLVTGFENHGGLTFLGQGVKPLGKVVKGYGNNGTDGFEGTIYKNTFCTYAHGSLLPKNPRFADHLIRIALEKKYGEEIVLAPLDDSLEEMAREYMIKEKA